MDLENFANVRMRDLAGVSDLGRKSPSETRLSAFDSNAAMKSFVDGLVETNHLEISGSGRDCTVEFAYRRPDDGTLPRIGPLTCGPR